MGLTTTQIGVMGENILINAVMKASDGRLSPFQPLADDDGLDVLFFDKMTGSAVAIQIKCRTVTIRKRNSEERGNSVHFHVRQATFKEARRAYLVAALFDEELTNFVATWFIPMEKLPSIAIDSGEKWAIRPSKSTTSVDRYAPFRCMTPEDLAKRIIAECEAHMAPI